jgi:hypothetical protein
MKWIKQTFVALFCISVMISCEYEFIEIAEPIPPNPEDTVSFANDVVPIFNTNNKCTSCHNTGGTQPDLTPANAYNSIVPALVVLDNPESSEIYQYPHLSSSMHTWKKYTDAEAQTVLIWIQQGAPDN